MADLPEKNEWTTGVYQLETSDPVLGGPEGIDNLQGKQLANRTRWLKDQIERIISGVTSIGVAFKLATARKISVTGAATGSATFDGSADVSIAITLADNGVIPGEYPKLVINAKGLVIGGGGLLASDVPALDWSKITTGKPATLDGYGIADAYNKTGIDWLLKAKAPLESPAFTGLVSVPTAPLGSNNALAANTEFVARAIAELIKQAPGALDTLAELAAAMGNDPNFATTITNLLAQKANKGTTLAAYGIADALKVGSVSRQQPVLAAPWPGETLSDAAFQIREAQEVAETQNSDAYAPGFSFYWKGRSAGKLIMDALGNLKWGGKPVLIGRYATFDELNSGGSDDTVVTPFKLRWGFSFLMGSTGYIQFPPWLGGFLVQWGVASDVPKASTAVGAAGPTRDVILPIAFTADVFRVFATMNFATMAATATGAASSAGTPGAIAISRSVIRVQNNYSGSDGEISWLAIGK